MKVFTKLGLVLLWLVMSTGMLVAQFDSKPLPEPVKKYLGEGIMDDLCVDGIYDTGCTWGDGLGYWDLSDVNVDTIGCDGILYDWYHDFTDMTHSFDPGMDYTLTVEASYTNTWVDIWIDWNDDNFMDSTELIINDWQLLELGIFYDTTFSIPADATPGDHYMRARTNWLSGPTGSCDTLTYGMCVDFMASVSGGASGGMATVYPVLEDYGTGSTDGTDLTETSLIKALGADDMSKGFAKWDVSEIPAGTTIDSIRMWVYVNDNNWPYWRITPLASDPITADALTIWDEVVAGEDETLCYSYNNESGTLDIGWHGYLLINNANADLTASLADGWFATGFGDIDVGTSYYVVLDGWAEDNMPYMEVYYGGASTNEVCENFDALTVGDLVAETLGSPWNTWSGTNADDAPVSDAFSYSASNSFTVNAGAVDLIYEFGAEAITDGIVNYSHYMYVPTGYSGYFNVQSDPVPGTAWVVDLYFDDDGTGYFATQSTDTFVYDMDTWFMVEIMFDFDAGMGYVYFDGELMTEFVNVETVGGIDYYGAATGGTPGAYYDDVCFEHIPPGGDLEPPTDLVGTVSLLDVMLEWNAPSGTGYNEVSNDDGTAETSFWVGEPSTVDQYLASRLTMPEDGTIQEVVLFARSPNASSFGDVIICADDGAGAPDLTNTYENFGSTEVPYVTLDWLTLTVTVPFDLTADEDFWVLVNWPDGNLSTDGPFIGADDTDPQLTRNYWSNTPGVWNEWTGHNWMMRAYYSLPGEEITDGGLQMVPVTNARFHEGPINATSNPVVSESAEVWKAPKIITALDALLGYNVYRDGEFLAYAENESYDDMGLMAGLYEYYVTAVYDEGESDPSNTVEVEVEEIILEECYYFDELTVGGYVAEQLGGVWDTWAGTPGGADDAFVSDAQSYSPSNSFIIDPNVDLIFKFNTEAITTGSWNYSHAMYVASGTTGYFNVQSDPAPGVAWVIEITFNDGGVGTFVVDAVTTDFTYTQDAWIMVDVFFNLDFDLGEVYFDGTLVHSFTTINSIGGIDYFGAAATDAAYYDDVCFVDMTAPECENFDALTAGDLVAESLGSPWNTWSGTNADDAPVVDDMYYSAPNSFQVNAGAVDLIREFPAALSEGQHLYSHWMYVPTGYSGYFNIQSDPTPGVAWVIDLYFDDGGTGSFAGQSTETFTYMQDTWFFVEINFDLNSGLAHVMFDGELMLEFENTLTIGGVDYYGANTGGEPGAYIDDVCFMAGYEIVPDPCEYFDDLAVDGYVAEQLGGMWTTWSGTPGTSEDAMVSDMYSYSPSNSFTVAQNVDMIYQFGEAAIDEGAWLYSHMMYVESGTTGYFNVQSDPTPGVAWVIEITFNDGGTGTFVVDAVSTDFTYSQDTWFWTGVNIDVDNGMGEVWFDDMMVHTFQTANTIGGIDYFGAAATDAAYYDDVCFEMGYEVLPPAPPTNLELMVDNGDIVLDWDAPAGSSNLIEIANDDGTFEASFWVGEPSTVDQYLASRLTMPEEGTIHEIAILTRSPNGSSFNDIIVCADNGAGYPDLNSSFANFGSTMVEWVDMDWLILTIDSPFDLTGGTDFWVLVNWPDGNLATDGPFVGSDDTDVQLARNYWSNVPGEWNEWTGHNWMMRAYYSAGEESYSGSGIAALPSNNTEEVSLPVSSVFSPVASDLSSNAPIITGAEALLGYNVYYSFDGGNFTMLEMVDVTTYTHEDPGYGEHCYYVTAIYDEGESDATNTACEELVGIEDNLRNVTQVYPNPASNLVNIKSDYTIERLVIYNFTGQVISDVVVSNGSHTVNVSEFNPGVYIFQIETTEGRVTERVIIE